MRSFHRTLIAAAYVCRLAAASIVILMMVTITYDVARRYLFADPTTWVLEVNAIALVALTFLAIPDLYIRDQHITMELVQERARSPFRRFSRNLVRIAVGLFALALTILGVMTMVAALRAGLLSAGMVPIPIWVVYAFVAFGSAMLLLLSIFRPARLRGDTGTEPDESTLRQKTEEVGPT